MKKLVIALFACLLMAQLASAMSFSLANSVSTNEPEVKNVSVGPMITAISVKGNISVQTSAILDLVLSRVGENLSQDKNIFNFGYGGGLGPDKNYYFNLTFQK